MTGDGRAAPGGGLRDGSADRDGDGWVTVDELYDYIADAVAETTPNQTPRKWDLDVHGTIRVAKSPAGRRKRAIVADGYPVLFGFRLYTSADNPEVAQTGRIPVPADGDQLIGGHAVMLVGYDDAEQSFIGRNSWGKDWGVDGYFWLRALTGRGRGRRRSTHPFGLIPVFIIPNGCG